MCGRIACNLCKEDYQSACSYFDETTKKYVKPEWRDQNNGGFSFNPSNNTCPSDVTPVLIAGSSSNSRCLMPMLWGLIPRFHKGEAKKHGLSTNNCRLEGIRNADKSTKGSALYSTPLREGKRCVVVCEGYYEWKTTEKAKKQPYFIYAEQTSVSKVYESECWTNSTWDEESGWQGPHLLRMAAIYDVWRNASGDEIYSYSVITMESNEKLSRLHHRMPAVLPTENLVQAWLDTERVPLSQALTVLNPTTALSWYPVSPMVNNSRCKDVRCNVPLTLSEKPTAKPMSPLKAWLTTGSMRKRPAQEQPSSTESDDSKVAKIAS